MGSKLVLALCCTGAGLLVLAAGVLGGFVAVPGNTSPGRPACDVLPTTREVTAALKAHPEVTEGLRSAAGRIRVSVSRPCSGDYADRALVRVRVTDDDGRDSLGDWLGTHDGYGVPIEVTVA